MYKNRRFGSKSSRDSKSNVTNENKRPLNSINEDVSIKIARPTVHYAGSQRSKAPSALEHDLAAAAGEVVVADVCTSSEENIPASQEPTQRYLSQRSAIASTLGRTQSRNASGTRPPTSYFEMVLIKAGVLLDEADNFVLSCDHVSFANKFREVCTKCPNYLENVDIFKNGLRDALAPTSKYCLKLLSGCTISAPGEDAVYMSQESMIVNFLMVNFLTDSVVEVLLEKIDHAATQATPVYLRNGTVPLLPLLLTQLRYAAITYGTTIYDRIKKTFPKANEHAKRDIIMNAELILNASRHDDFVQMLLDHATNSKDIFNAYTMQAITNLSLAKPMQERVRHRILDYIEEKEFSNSILPQLVNFLLKVLNEASDEEIRELVTTIRQILVLRMDKPMERQTQLDLFKHIEQALMRSKRFYSIWQKVISTLSPTQFRSTDFIILLLLIHVKDDNYLYIENILRRRIKLEHINVNIFTEMKTNYRYLLEQHMNTLMQLLHDFLRERHFKIANFAKVSYSVLFEICDSTQRSILRNLLQLTCDKNLTNLALELLQNIQRKYRTEIQNWGTLLMPLLDRLADMSLSQTRATMVILSGIAFPPPPLSECQILQDQIDMLLKKQIISRSSNIKKQGIIGSVQLIDSMARIEENIIEHDDFNTSYTASSLPDGRGKMAANFIMLVSSATTHCAESLALFYDELASVCMRSPSESDRPNCIQLDKPFLIWLCDMMTFHFQNNFVAEDQPTDSLYSGIKLTYQKCINRPEDATNTEESEAPTIAINIAELVLKPSNVASSSVLTLAPLLNLVRALYLQRYKGSLEQINALLGCAIILPNFFDDPNTDAIFYDYDEHIQKKILDIYFHCVNWMRETVCSFSTQCDEMLRHKVLQRLNELIITEEKVRKLLIKAPIDYMPPQSQFIYPTACIRNKPSARGRHAASTNKSKARNTDNNTEFLLNETHGNVTNMADVTIKLAAAGKPRSSECKTNFDVLYGPKETYRQLDSNIMLILREELNIKYPLPEINIGEQIGLLEYRFILNDLVCKLESVTDMQKCQNEQPLQHIANPHYFMYDLSKFLPKITANMLKLSNVIDAQLKAAKYVYSNGDLFTEEFNFTKVCFNMTIRLLAVFFSWSQFSDANTLLKESLLALLDPAKLQSLRGKATSSLAADCFEVVHGFEPAVMDLKTAVYLLELLGTLKRFSNNENTNEKQEKCIRTLCKKLLQRKWFNYDGSAEKGGACNVYLDILVKGFLKDSDFCRQMKIFHVILDECKQLSTKESALKCFPNLTKANFPLLFRGFCESVISELSSLINKSTSTNTGAKIKIWENSCELLNTLLDIVKRLDIPRNFQLFLKHSHVYLKLLLQHGMQVFEESLRQDPERVSGFLKNLQTITRFLHNLCCHSKALRHTAIIAQIPALRETVETLVFRVKALMTANKCASVFEMGKLRNKDLHGDEILSQATIGSSGTTDHDSDEDIPEDDDSIDETILVETRERQTSASVDAGSTTRNNRSKTSSRSKCF